MSYYDQFPGAVARDERGKPSLKKSFLNPFTLIAFMVGIASGRIMEKVLK